MQDRRIDVALGFDAAYAPHAAAVIASAARRTGAGSLRFILAVTGLDAEERRRVESAGPGALFCWIEVHRSDLPLMGDNEHIAHVSEATFLRLALEYLAPADCNRLIYLDADVIVLRDLKELWNADLGGAPLGAVVDTFADKNAFAQLWSLDANASDYFNAGVLLIDMEQVRAEKLFTRAMQFVFDHKPVFADQDALNWVAWGRWRRLENVWNVQRDMVIDAISADLSPDMRLMKTQYPGVVHFTGRDKPWLATGWNPWSWIYWSSLARTPFKRVVEQRYKMDLVRQAKLFVRWAVRKPAQAPLCP